MKKNCKLTINFLLSFILVWGSLAPACLAAESIQEPPTLEGIDIPNIKDGLVNADNGYEQLDLCSKVLTGSEEPAVKESSEKATKSGDQPTELVSKKDPSTDKVESSSSASAAKPLLAEGVPKLDQLKPPMQPDGSSKVVNLSASTSRDYNEINKLSNRILKKEVELLKLNTAFRIQTTKQGKFKRWRTFAYNLGASTVSFAGITTVAAENWRSHHNAKKGNREAFIAGPLLLLIGHSIVLGGIVIESSLDLHKTYKNKKNGKDAGSVTKKVLVLQSDIDTLLKQREDLVKAYSHPSPLQEKFILTEGRVLKDVRDLALLEYAQFYTRARKRAWGKVVSYMNGSAIATTGGFQGSLNGMLAIINKRRMQALPAGLGFLESGALIVAAPWIKKGTAKITGRITKKKIHKKLGDLGKTTIKNLRADLRELKTVTAQLPSNQKPLQMTHRIDLYDDGEGVFKQQALFNAIEKSKSRKEFWERVAFNSAIGGTKMAWGINLAYAGATFPTGGGRRVEQFRRIVANGSTTFVVGTSIWMIDTLQARTRGEMDLYTLGTQQATPIHKLNKRLAALEALDKKLKI